jgi:hypothetical protein
MTGNIQRHLWRPLSIEASTQLDELQQLLLQIPRNVGDQDKWMYI